MSSKRTAPDDNVIDLTFDSDEEETGANSNSNNNFSVASARSSKRARTSQGSSASKNNGFDDDDDDDEIIVIDKEDYDKKPAAKPSPKATPKSSEDGIEVVDSSVARPTASAAAASASNDDDEDDELEVVGTRNEYKLPHLRQYCTTFKFTVNTSNRADLRTKNEKHCDKCYCYVCDAPVKECKSWTSTDSAWQKNHCNATNEHNCWKHKKEQMKDGTYSENDSSGGPRFTMPQVARRRSPATGRNLVGFDHFFAALMGGRPFGRDMFDDDDDEEDDDDDDEGTYWDRRDAPQHYLYSQHNRKAHAPGQLPENLDASAYPACPHCKWHNNVQGMQVHNGQRCFKCGRLAAPRKKPNQYTHKYAFKNGNHRLGVREISFRIVAQDVRKDPKFRSSWQGAGKNDRNWQYNESAMMKAVFDYKIGKRPKLNTSLLSLISEWEEDTTRQKNEDSIIMDPADIDVIREISAFSIDRVAGILHGDVSAVWDAQNSVGTIKIQLDLARVIGQGSGQSNHRLVGCWFKTFPLRLSTISGLSKTSLHLPSRGSSDEFEFLTTQHNEEADRLRSSLSLLSGTGNPDVGGFTDTDISLRGIFEKFYREFFADQYIGRSSFDLDKISDHKNENNRSDLSSVLSHRDLTFTAKCLQNARKNRGSTGSVLAHVENLGHTPELACEGLAVELLEFQKQSLKWAMERETTTGGIQSYWWGKLPIEGTQLYFNPITGGFRASKPKEVRGGIIAEEMGLGKTIISLALILKHPAPLQPESGSKTTCLSTAPAAPTTNTPTWNEELYDQTSSDKNPLRGSILSRGTLVICPVSLVGQWIEEAKSKLSDPGLLYPYHGGSRKRDPNILAKNAIVVTTYQVLVSDDTYHRKKSSNPGTYCPPLEQVRWWRVICDEGHQLRQANTNRNRSISQLVADHKWIVTGTPVSTSMLDLANQLKLLGIESVDEMMRTCCTKPNSRNGNQHIKNPGKLLFLLRNVMMRHTQKQCYRGTSTTLMSLPPKTERSIDFSLSKRERKEYDALDKTAKDFYVGFRAAHLHKLSSHYLLLSQKLTPLRAACSGGNPPLNPEEGGSKGDEFDEEEDVKVHRKSEIKYSDFCFTTKLKVLIKELKKARENDPTSKSLVFSQFSSTLKWLKDELPKHGFEFRTLSGNMSMKQRAKALHDFQADPPTTIFLLSMRAGNCGINLTQANRVFLMEPGFNPALEQQAIGRVHRLGQKRNVEIIRLFVKNTIETRIRKFLEKKYGTPANDASNKEKKKRTGDGSEEAETEVIEVPVGNLATERPKNRMVASEFDMLFGVESDSQPNVAMPDAAPDSATSSGML